MHREARRGLLLTRRPESVHADEVSYHRTVELAVVGNTWHELGITERADALQIALNLDAEHRAALLHDGDF